MTEEKLWYSACETCDRSIWADDEEHAHELAEAHEEEYPDHTAKADSVTAKV